MVYVLYFKRSLLTVLSISVDGFRIKGPTIKKILLLEAEQTYYNPKKSNAKYSTNLECKYQSNNGRSTMQ